MLLGTRARQRGFGAAALAVYDMLFRLGAELDLCFARAIAQRRLIKSETEYLTVGPLGVLIGNHG